MDQKIKNSYRHNLDTGLIISLILTILIFYLFPRFSEQNPRRTNYIVTIEIIRIPPTQQNIIRRPPPPKPVIPVADEEIDILMPVQINTDSSNHLDAFHSDSDFQSGLPEGYRPRQILEVVPEKVAEEIKGEIVLALRIGESGKVIEFRILQNISQSLLCQEHALKAAQASLWESAIINGKPVKYWIEKTYKFNIE